MDPLTYKVIHLVGVMMLFTGISAAFVQKSGVKGAAAFHGIALVLLLISGFGMIAKSGGSFGYSDGWIIAKIVIWVLFGAMIVIAKKRVLGGAAGWSAAIVLGAIAAFMALYKPF